MSARTVSDASGDLFALASMLRAAESHLVAFQDSRREARLQEGIDPGAVSGELDGAHDVELVLRRAAVLADELGFELAESDVCAHALAISSPCPPARPA